MERASRCARERWRERQDVQEREGSMKRKRAKGEWWSVLWIALTARCTIFHKIKKGRKEERGYSTIRIYSTEAR